MSAFILLGVLALDQQTSGFHALDQEVGDVEATATFVFKCNKKIKESSDSGRNARSDSFTAVQVDSDGNTSPVTCVTITPAFWKKRDGVQGDQRKDRTKQDESWQIAEITSSDNIDIGDTSREEGICPKNRESFCSALSSADDEEDAEKDGDSYVSETDVQDGHASTAKLTSEGTANRKADISEGSVNESDHDKSSDDETKEDDDDEDDEDAKTIIKCDPDNESTHKNRSQDSNQNQNYKGLFGEPLHRYYETEVYSAKVGAGGTGRQRKILRTRRVSDTHIGYKRETDPKIIPQDETLKFGSENSNYDRGHGKNVTDSSSAERCLNVSAYPVAISSHRELQVDAENREDEKEQRGCKSGATSAYVSENNRMGFRQVYSQGRDERLPPSEDRASGTNYCSPNLSECCLTKTPDNVFVKTTRKIFSPVRRDSKGKASSVISYVVGETCGMDSTQVLQEAEQSMAVTSPVISVLRREQSGNISCETTSATQSKGIISSNGMSPPSWMFTRNRSELPSPALTRRTPSTVDKARNETINTSDSNLPLTSQNKSSDGIPQAELNETGTPGAKRKCESNVNKEPELNLKPGHENVANKCVGEYEIIKPEKQPNLKGQANSQREPSPEKNKTDRSDSSMPSSRPVTPSPSFPPLPLSPNPGRRDLYKVTTKETAPSIRMMIAKYNQKLTEQQEGPGGRSPEVSGSGSASPVAWRSPVAERRVRAQMEKYQEEVQRVLEQGGRKVAARPGGNKVQKSASDGIIRAPEKETVPTSEGESNKNSTDAAITKPLTLSTKPRSILKSPSAGSINSTTPVPVTVNSNRTVEAALSSEAVRATAKPPSPRVNPSPSPSSPSSPELGQHHSSPPPSRLRALRLQRAKEEFLTRGPGGRSWTSDGGTTSTDTPSASVSPEPFWGQEAADGSRKDIIRPGLRMRETDSVNRSRLSQVSVESESSYDSSVMFAGGSRKDTSTVSDEGMLLVKSASAGMINIDPNTYRKFYEDRGAADQQPGTSDTQDDKSKAQACSRFGISSITSRFRRVKMRRSKDRDGGKMNTVSMLCRQSLLVDLHLSKEGETSGAAEVTGPSTSKSCPSSPALQRSSSVEKPEPGTSNAPTSWILNPARKIFKPK
jgi:hypothetical protein